jgi:hypothetical protein
MDAAFFWLSIFIGSQVAIILLGLLPLRMWRSFRSRNEKPGDESPGISSGLPESA